MTEQIDVYLAVSGTAYIRTERASYLDTSLPSPTGSNHSIDFLLCVLGGGGYVPEAHQRRPGGRKGGVWVV